MELIRRNTLQDTPQLRQLWQCVYGDTDAYLDLFFSCYGQPGQAVVLELDGTIQSALHMLPVGRIWMPSGTTLPFSYIYAVATASAQRRKGYSTRVLQETIRLQQDAGFACSGLCIAEEQLFTFYRNVGGFTDCFYVRVAELTAAPEGGRTDILQPATPEAYNDFRNRFLQQRGHLFLQFAESAIAFQKAISGLAGGDIILLGKDSAWGCAVVERDADDAVIVKELLCPEDRSVDALTTIADAYPAKTYLVRGPAEMHNSFGGAVRRCGQTLRLDGDPKLQSNKLGYYGLMFD